MDWPTLLFAIAAALTLLIGMIHFVTWLSGFVGGKGGFARDLDKRLERIADMAERTERAVRDEHQTMRKESETRGRALREEVGEGILKFGTSLQASMTDGRTSVDKRFEEFARTHAELANALRRSAPHDQHDRRRPKNRCQSARRRERRDARGAAPDRDRTPPVFTFSVLLPTTKMLLSFITLIRMRELPGRLAGFLVHRSGKWSMADVMVVAIFMAFIGFNGVVDGQLSSLEDYANAAHVLTTNNSNLESGFYLFTLYCLIGLITSALLPRTLEASVKAKGTCSR